MAVTHNGRERITIFDVDLQEEFTSAAGATVVEPRGNWKLVSNVLGKALIGGAKYPTPPGYKPEVEKAAEIKKPPVSEAAREAAELRKEPIYKAEYKVEPEIKRVEAAAKPVTGLGAPIGVEMARPGITAPAVTPTVTQPAFAFPEKYYWWIVIGAIALIIIAIAGLFYISQWFHPR